VIRRTEEKDLSIIELLFRNINIEKKIKIYTLHTKKG